MAIYKHFKVGDRVLTRYLFDGKRRLGTIVRKDGEVCDVTLDYTKQTEYPAECYISELDLADGSPEPE